MLPSPFQACQNPCGRALSSQTSPPSSQLEWFCSCTFIAFGFTSVTATITIWGWLPWFLSLNRSSVWARTVSLSSREPASGTQLLYRAGVQQKLNCVKVVSRNKNQDLYINLLRLSDKTSQTGVLTQQKFIFSVLDTRSLRPQRWQGWFLPKLLSLACGWCPSVSSHGLFSVCLHRWSPTPCVLVASFYEDIGQIVP